MWLNAVRFLFAFDVRRDAYPTLFQKLVYACVSWQWALGLSAFVYFHYKHVPGFLARWEEYKHKHGGAYVPHLGMRVGIPGRSVGTDVLVGDVGTDCVRT